MLRSVSFLTCTVLAVTISSFGQVPTANPHTSSVGTAKPRDPTQQGMGMPMSMPLVAPFFIENGDYQSSITMVNELVKPVHGMVLAKARDGSEIGRKVITFAPHSRTVLPVSELLSSKAAQTIGSIELDPDPMEAMNMPIAAQVSIVNNRELPATYLEEEFMAVDPNLQPRYRAVVPSTAGSPVIAVLSTSSSQQNVTIRCSEESGSVIARPVDLAGHQMLLLPACKAGGNEDGLKGEFETVFQTNAGKHGALALGVETDASPGSLAVWGISALAREHPAEIALNFTNAASLRTKDTIYAGVPVGTADLLPGDTFTPRLAVANYGDKAAEVSVSYSSMTADSPQTKTVATLLLRAGSVQEVSLPKLSGDPLLRNSFVVSSDAAPGAIVSNLVLEGQQQYPAVQLVGKDPAVNNGGGHPWSIANGDQSTALLFNRSGKQELFNVNIVANGTKWHQEYKLQPSETKAIRIGDLVKNQVKDKRGATLPAEATAGEISWFTVDAGKAAGRVLVSNPETGLARNFSCGYNLVLCGTFLPNWQATFGLASDGYLGDLFSNTCTAYNPQACSGGQYSSQDGGYAINWWSNTPSIAPLTGANYNPSAAFYGQHIGTGTASGQMSTQYCQPQSGGTNNVVTYTQQDLNNLAGALIGYTSIDSNGNIYGAQLDQDAFNYLVSAGFISAGAGVATVWEIPAVGPVVVYVTASVYIALKAAKALELWSEARGLSDPKIVRSLPTSTAGTRLSNGQCNPNQPIPNYKWRAVNLTGASAGIIHWHWYTWNQNPTTCVWYLGSRQEGPNDPGPNYILIPGLY